MFRTRSFRRDASFRPTLFLSAIVATVALCVLTDAATSFGQDPTAPIPVGKDLLVPPTGELAQFARIRATLGPTQPVEWKLPKGGIAEVATANGFARDAANENLFALDVDSVYRFRVSNVEAFPNAVLYPTLELLGRLNPPAGKAWDFPIEIYVPLQDIEAALNGSLVTRVVFLENSANPANVDVSDNPDRLTLDVPRGVDPIVAAQTRGRVLAIVRLGSREPTEEPNETDPFYFGLPRAEFKPAPAPVVQNPLLEKADDTGFAVSGESDEEEGFAVSGEIAEPVESAPESAEK